MAYRRYRAASESLVLYSTQILPRAEENLRSIRAAYNFGEFSVLDVIAEQRRLTENVTAYNQFLRDYYSALAELEIALGTTIPVSGFAPSLTSILPDINSVPQQIDQGKLLQTLIQSTPFVVSNNISKQTANTQKLNEFKRTKEK
jgi:hypothetical protein